MTQYDAAPAPTRGIGLKGPITGLVLVGLVVYGTYWGWERAFGDETVDVNVSSGCPTPTSTTTAPPTTGTATPAAMEADTAADTSIASAFVALTGQVFDAAGRMAAGPAAELATVANAAPVPTAPTATTSQPQYVQPSGVLVNVINATGRRGLAANTAAVLRDRGFAVQSIANAPPDDLVPEVAQIRASSVTSPQALLLAQHVPGAVIVADGRTDASVNLVLGDAFSALGDPTLVTPVPLPATGC